MKTVLTEAKAGKWSKTADGKIEVAGTILMDGEYTLKLISKEGVASQALSSGKGVVILDTKITPALEEEGMARDLVRLVQQARKESGFHVSDHIALSVGISSPLKSMIEKHTDYIKEQTLADALIFGESPTASIRDDWKLGKDAISIELKRIG